MKKREIWVDNVKLIACLLVLLGHFFQSMVKANIISSTNVYIWFNTTIYYFHVPLFFLCSGYLYQKYSVVGNISDWLKNIMNKLIALGIPYFVFASATWLLKKVFSGSVNQEVSGWGESLLISPLSPYWYLYVLFFIFVCTWTMNNKKMLYLFIEIAIIMKIVSFEINTNIYVVDKLLSNEIWFIFGMSYSYYLNKNNETNRRDKKLVFIILFLIFILLSIIPKIIHFDNKVGNFIYGVLACLSIIGFLRSVYKDQEQNKIIAFFSGYTMPIFLMHTLFAAPLRSILLKLGIVQPAIHIVLGIGISIFGPIFAAIIISKIKYLDIILYPSKYIKIK